MDYIETTLKSLIKENSEWIKELTAFPNSSTKLTKDELSYYKDLSTYKDCKTDRTYRIIKKLFESQRSVHPAWFFILRDFFENDNFSFEEKTIDELNILNIIVPENIEMTHSIQIIATLKMYYILLRNSKIVESFLKKRSKFTQKYIQFNTIWKYLFFPAIELRDPQKFAIDLSYNFNGTDIHIEINEPHHTESKDTQREHSIFFLTGKRIVHYYVSKKELDKDKDKLDLITRINNCINHDLPKVIENIFFKMTESIFNTNEHAGLVFYTFISDIIYDLSIAIVFSELKKESLEKKLTWGKFQEYCNSIGIKFNLDYIKIIEAELEHLENEETKKQLLNTRFYNFKKLDENALLTVRGYDYYLMSLTPAISSHSIVIKDIYSAYKEKHEEIMAQLFRNAKNEQTIIRTHSENQYTKLLKQFNDLKKMMIDFGKSMINSDLNRIKK